MDKKTKLAIERWAISRAWFGLELPEEFIRELETVGYRYLEIAVTDKTTGEPPQKLYAICRPEAFKRLGQDITEAARRASADFVGKAVIDSFSVQGSPWESGDHTIEHVLNRRTLGGKPKGMTTKQRSVLRRYEAWKKTNPYGTVRDFCDATGEARSTLDRALKNSGRKY